MKLELNSELLNRGISIGSYGTLLGDLDIYEDCTAEFEKCIIDTYVELTQDALKENDIECIITPKRIDRPRFYNYSDDSLVFDLKIDDNFLESLKSIADCADFLAFINNEYKSRSGFISFMPSSRYEFLNAIEIDIERALASYLNYLLKTDTDILQSEFYDTVYETASSYGWIIYEEVDE